MSKQIYIAWTAYQRRADSMRSALNLELYHLPPRYKSRLGKLLGYVLQLIQTARLVFVIRPDIVWVQSPPSFLIHFLLLLKCIPFFRFSLIADCHNAALRAPWIRIPFAVQALNMCNRVLIHNSEVLEQARALGIAEKKMMVLEDLPAEIRPLEQKQRTQSPFIVVPCSFHEDEPVDCVLDAARLMPDIQFQITGNKYKAEQKGYLAHAPQNVCFTGFLSLEDYDQLFDQASVVLGITTKEGIQLSVANEAIGAGKALVLSDTKILRHLFGEAAIFSLNTPENLAGALREALAHRALLEQLSRNLKVQRIQDWHQKADILIKTLHAHSSSENAVVQCSIQEK